MQFSNGYNFDVSEIEKLEKPAVPMKTRVLVVEDEADIRRILKDLLDSQGFHVVDLASGHAILHQIELHQPDVLLVDQMMPGITGSEIIAQIRKDERHGSLPIIMVTGLSGEEDKVRVLNLGADDYVTKPFLPKELAARINALVRRTASRELAAKSDPQELIRGNIRIELRSHRAFISNEEVQLTLTEFKILRELLRQVDHVLTREQLRERALESVNVTDRTIDVHMASLRKKLGTVGDTIETVRGVGYRLAR
jgi:DNA-binding response OmpR family regulator